MWHYHDPAASLLSGQCQALGTHNEDVTETPNNSANSGIKPLKTIHKFSK